MDEKNQKMIEEFEAKKAAEAKKTEEDRFDETLETFKNVLAAVAIIASVAIAILVVNGMWVLAASLGGVLLSLYGMHVFACFMHIVNGISRTLKGKNGEAKP